MNVFTRGAKCSNSFAKACLSRCSATAAIDWPQSGGPEGKFPLPGMVKFRFAEPRKRTSLRERRQRAATATEIDCDRAKDSMSERTLGCIIWITAR